MIFGKLFNRPKHEEIQLPPEFLDLQKAKDELTKVKKESALLEEKITDMRETIRQKTFVLTELNANLEKTESKIIAQDVGLSYDYPPENLKIGFIEYDIVVAKETLTKMIKSKEYYTATKDYTVDNSVTKGRAFVNAFCENNILGFNLYCEKKKKGLTIYNFSDTMELIDKAFARYDKKLHIIHAYFNPKYLELTKKWLKLELDLKVKKQQEKERVREEKRKLREEQQMLAEAEKERKKLEAERANLQKLFAKAITEQEQEEIKAKLAKVDKRVEEIDWRTSHYSAGWLYITTTPSMPNIYKCGCTKQINPLNRLAQLSSASVPFPFECRGLVFSENVFDLEAKMHRRLDSKRVNKGNKLKEFFYGEPEEAIKILTDEFHEEVRFIDEHWIDSGKDNGNEIG